MNKIYLFYGDNQDLINYKKDEIIEKSMIDDFNISIFDMEETPLSVALADAKSIPFLSDHRIVVFKNAYFFSSEKIKNPLDESTDELKDFLENYPETTISIFTVPYRQIDSKKVIVKLVKENGEIIECPPYSKEDITRWIDITLKNNNHNITLEARNELMNRLDSDPYNFKNEINKLLLYLKDGERISLDIVKDVIIKDPEDNVFELLNAITTHNRKDALNIYYDLLENGNTSLQLLNLIERKFQEILYSKELIKANCTQEEFMNTFKVSKGRAYYMMKNAKEMTYKTIKLWLKRTSKLDFDIKAGKVDQDAGVELLILKA